MHIECKGTTFFPVLEILCIKVCSFEKKSVTLQHFVNFETHFSHKIMAYLLHIMHKYAISTLLIIFIWIICLVPIPEVPMNGVAFIDKWTHLAMYAVLAICIWTEYGIRNKGEAFQMKRLALWGCIMPMIMGGLIELAQAYLTTCRSGEWLDLLADAVGVIIGCGIGALLLRSRKGMDWLSGIYYKSVGRL